MLSRIYGDDRMKISVIGGGYVGLVSSACFAELGHSVDLVEIDEEKVEAINSGEPPIYEKGLEELLRRHAGRNLRASSIYDEVCNTEISFICVGTPSGPEGEADLSMIEAASRSVGESLQEGDGYHVVVVKSTVPPGTTRDLVIPTVLRYHGSVEGGRVLGFAMNPEFLREGLAVQDFMKPDRIVICCSETKAGVLVESAYERLNAPVIRVGLSSAEMIKYASNALLATKISFSNEVGNICKKIDIDVYEVMRGVGMDHRISPHFLNTRAGFGGSCFPKDVMALIRLAEIIGEDPMLLKSVIEVNRRQPLRMVELLERRLGDLEGKEIAVLGLAFKSDTDDVRDSRSIPLINELKKRGAKVRAYDPLATSNMRQIVPDIEYCAHSRGALEDADGCFIMTEWPEFAELDGEFELMRSRVIIEGRKVLSCKGAEGVCW
jgi:UDPglucose 6-dehydrogenase